MAEEVLDDDEQEQQYEVPQGFWFANQVVTDACGTLAVLNTVLNLPGDDADVQLGEELSAFRDETGDFEPKASLVIPVFCIIKRRR